MALFQLADVVTSARGSKTARILACDGSANVVYRASDNGLCAPFGPGNFDKSADATRMNFEVRLDDEHDLSYFDQLDAWALVYITGHSERLFKKVMTTEQVVAGYHPCVRRKEGYVPLLHTKVNTEGSSAICFWDADGVARSQPTEWAHTRLQLRFRVSHLWIMGPSFGLVINSIDAKVLSEGAPAQRTCPF